jgi:NAD(P)-dependent dehydrogenase (short-subunit alcohol dehydrogenase family)
MNESHAGTRRGDDPFRLDGRVALITGGTRGIGRAVAARMAERGARVVVSSRKEEACSRTVAELRSQGFEVLGVPCHMGSTADIRNLVRASSEHFGSIDILVNNAANALALPIGSFTEEALQKSFEVNLKGPVLLVQEALPYLQASPAASVINMVSAGAWLFSANVAMYAAAKAAMVSYTKSMAAALAPLGIRVNALAPGSVDTDMVRNTGPDAMRGMAAACLLRRIAHPDEIADPAVFLASDASRYMTGTVIHVDGGLVTR